ncbi:MAG: YggS family pyridoxal phosphate-dependent enzyme [Pseudomonadota bacterium]
MTSLEDVYREIDAAANASNRDRSDITLIAVSKTFGADRIEPVLGAGQTHFGENRVQESQKKWPDLKAKYPNAVLHLIGPLQSNKASDAVALFDVIHTVDRDKIAKALSAEMERQGRKLDVFVQVNTGREQQKAGVMPEETRAFVERCRTVHNLSVRGLMCIPPIDEDPRDHFALLAEYARESGLSDLSMGMSADFPIAISCGATHVRVGSAIFGARDRT